MCQMWAKIRQGVRWNPTHMFALAVRGMDLKQVKNIKISIDPFHADNAALRSFWNAVGSPRIKATNPATRVTAEVRNDGQGPFFEADLADGRKVVFRTAGLQSADVVMRFNRLLGLPEIGKAGLRPRPQ